jgi:hypothetical protein
VLSYTHNCLMKKWILILVFLLPGITGYMQTVPADSISRDDQSLLIDTTIDYDELLNDLEMFLDSILAPRTYLLVSMTGTKSYYQFTKGDTDVVTKGQIRLSPTLGYYHKSGAGITFSGDLTQYKKDLRLYQYSISPSFDFIQDLRWTGGFSYTRYFTKDKLPFYTTPLQNEVSAYFLSRKGWLQPGITASYGWGSRKDVESRVHYLRVLSRLRQRRNNTLDLPILTDSLIAVLTTRITEEGISDFSVVPSLRHNFYWLNITGDNDYIKFTPLITCSFGTQKFGFNQVTSYTVRNNNTATGVNTGSQSVTLDEQEKFKMLSLTLFLRPEYVIGKFFIQPQFILDYYFPAQEKNLTALFSLNAGIMF